MYQPVVVATKETTDMEKGMNEQVEEAAVKMEVVEVEQKLKVQSEV